jgi:hypothetical protein
MLLFNTTLDFLTKHSDDIYYIKIDSGYYMSNNLKAYVLQKLIYTKSPN